MCRHQEKAGQSRPGSRLRPGHQHLRVNSNTSFCNYFESFRMIKCHKCNCCLSLLSSRQHIVIIRTHHTSYAFILVKGIYLGLLSEGSNLKSPPLDQRQRTKEQNSRSSTFPASLTLDQLDLDKDCGSGIYHLIPCKSTSG